MKKIIASLCAVALAAALPMSAFGVGSKPDTSQPTPDTPGADTPVRDDVYQAPYGTITVDKDGTTVYTMSNAVVGNLEVEGLVSMSVADANISYIGKVTEADVLDGNLAGTYDEAAKAEFESKLADMGEIMGMYEIIGTTQSEDGATIVQGMPDLANHTVKVLILHKGWVEELTLEIGADGILTIPVGEFSVFAFADLGLTADLKAAQETTRADRANGTSPQTGF